MSEHTEVAHAKALELFSHDQDGKPTPAMVTNIFKSKMNSWHYFFVGPDGSKEWWATSDFFNTKRDEFKAFLNSTVDRDLFLTWTESWVGEECDDYGIIRD
ncbi:hypothetical protein M0R72_06325 [Candidatus Pacearchaeota archaeon]|nr:hypothetical protein [Candidatus Pacearchaeota archaeon]